MPGSRESRPTFTSSSSRERRPPCHRAVIDTAPNFSAVPRSFLLVTLRKCSQTWCYHRQGPFSSQLLMRISLLMGQGGPAQICDFLHESVNSFSSLPSTIFPNSLAPLLPQQIYSPNQSPWQKIFSPIWTHIPVVVMTSFWRGEEPFARLRQVFTFLTL